MIIPEDDDGEIPSIGYPYARSNLDPEYDPNYQDWSNVGDTIVVEIESGE